MRPRILKTTRVTLAHKSVIGQLACGHRRPVREGQKNADGPPGDRAAEAETK